MQNVLCVSVPPRKGFSGCGDLNQALSLLSFYLFTNSALISATDGPARILYLPPYAATGFKPMSVELHKTGTFEGRSSN